MGTLCGEGRKQLNVNTDYKGKQGKAAYDKKAVDDAFEQRVRDEFGLSVLGYQHDEKTNATLEIVGVDPAAEETMTQKLAKARKSQQAVSALGRGRTFSFLGGG